MTAMLRSPPTEDLEMRMKQTHSVVFDFEILLC